MPRKPRRGCAQPGCGSLAEEGSQYCKEHKAQADRNYNKYTRDPEAKKKYGNQWQKIRARYVAEHPLCEQCLEEGRLRTVDEVHHIIPVSRGGTNDEENLMSLCKSCHTKIHFEMGDRRSRI